MALSISPWHMEKKLYLKYIMALGLVNMSRAVERGDEVLPDGSTQALLNRRTRNPGSHIQTSLWL